MFCYVASNVKSFSLHSKYVLKFKTIISKLKNKGGKMEARTASPWMAKGRNTVLQAKVEDSEGI